MYKIQKSNRTAPTSNPEAPSNFLSDISHALAESLDYEVTLATVAKLALPYIGGWCIVDVVEADGSIRRIAVVHPDSAKQTAARRLEKGWPPAHEDALGAPAALRFRTVEMIPCVDDQMLVSLAHDEEHLQILRDLGIGSVLMVPLIARRQVMGAITFVSSSDTAPYADYDRALAEDIASRAALAIDNARLYRESQDARAEAEAANLAKTQFLATTSHEIRTPINAIIGYTDLLTMGIYGTVPEKQMQQLERIRGSAQHLIGLVNEVLDVARIEAGGLTLNIEKAAFCDSVDLAFQLVHPHAVAAGIQLDNDCTHDPCLTYIGDPDRVRQILSNLFANACKFNRADGRVAVSCGYATNAGNKNLQGKGPWAFLRVEDTGIGIPADKLEVIFEPFVQVDQSLTRTQEGTGLGLAISRQLARLMRGDLTVQSVEGSGAAFTLWLPAGEREEAESDDLERKGLARLAEEILDRRDEALDAYVERLRRDPLVPPGAPVMMIQNHAVNYISGVAQHLAALAESTETANMMARDSATLQHKVAEVHGAQRRRMGWSEAALRRDWQIFREEMESLVHGVFVDGEDKPKAMAVIAHHFSDGEKHSIRAFRRSAREDFPHDENRSDRAATASESNA